MGTGRVGQQRLRCVGVGVGGNDIYTTSLATIGSLIGADYENSERWSFVHDRSWTQIVCLRGRHYAWGNGD